MLGALIYGISASGGPNSARDGQFDLERVNNISSLRYDIENYFSKYGVLPETLLILKEKQASYTRIDDPETSEIYEYQPNTKPIVNAFKLCANFATDTQTMDSKSYYGLGYAPDMRHPEGNYCFEFEIPPNLFPASGYPTSGQFERAVEKIATPSATTR